MMCIYTLTARGKKLARSVTNPDSSTYQVIHFLDRQGYATTEQIANACGLTPQETSRIITKLRHPKARIVTELSGAPM